MKISYRYTTISPGMVSMPHLDVKKAAAGVSVLLWNSEAILKLKGLVQSVLGLEPRASHIPGRHSTTEPQLDCMSSFHCRVLVTVLWARWPSTWPTTRIYPWKKCSRDQISSLQSASRLQERSPLIHTKKTFLLVYSDCC